MLIGIISDTHAVFDEVQGCAGFEQAVIII
jgi:hypothetical protein